MRIHSGETELSHRHGRLNLEGGMTVTVSPQEPKANEGEAEVKFAQRRNFLVEIGA